MAREVNLKMVRELNLKIAREVNIKMARELNLEMTIEKQTSRIVTTCCDDTVLLGFIMLLLI